MPKAKVKDILTYATENRFGVAAINTLNIETVKYVIEAAERERVPIIVQFYPGFSDYTDLKYLAFAACDMAEKASIPVGVHLDHSVTYEIAVGGIRDGFPSVMIDGSYVYVYCYNNGNGALSGDPVLLRKRQDGKLHQREQKRI